MAKMAEVQIMQAQLFAKANCGVERLTPPVSSGKKMNLTLGAGFYNHETALAISAGARVSENWTLSGSIGYVAYGDDESDSGGRVAATFEF